METQNVDIGIGEILIPQNKATPTSKEETGHKKCRAYDRSLII